MMDLLNGPTTFLEGLIVIFLLSVIMARGWRR